MRRQTIALLACTTLSVGLGNVASAADMGRRVAPAPAPMVAQVYNWTGLYVGVHAGWGWSNVDASTAPLPSAPVFGMAPFSFSNDADGFLAGGQVGFNYQINNWVIGIEADLSWTDINNSTTVAPLLFFVGVPLAGSFQTSSVDMNWFGTVRSRLGFAANNLLVYVTGGLAFADIDHTVVTILPPLFPGVAFAASSSETRAGWTIGGGFEWGLAPNWSVKGEYLYYDLGDTSVFAPLPAAPGAGVLTTFDNTGHILRLGLNYRFGWGGPIAARY